LKTIRPDLVIFEPGVLEIKIVEFRIIGPQYLEYIGRVGVPKSDAAAE
jgi:hypothetical protein